MFVLNGPAVTKYAVIFNMGALLVPSFTVYNPRPPENLSCKRGCVLYTETEIIFCFVKIAVYAAR